MGLSLRLFTLGLFDIGLSLRLFALQALCGGAGLCDLGIGVGVVGGIQGAFSSGVLVGSADAPAGPQELLLIAGGIGATIGPALCLTECLATQYVVVVATCIKPAVQWFCQKSLSLLGAHPVGIKNSREDPIANLEQASRR